LLLSLVETGSQTAQLAAKKKQANDAQRSPPMREAERGREREPFSNKIDSSPRETGVRG